MKIMKRIFAVALVLMMLCSMCIAHAAIGSSIMLGFSTDSKDGILTAAIRTTDTGKKDLNFAVRTENGELKVEAIAIMRDEPTTWFVVLDYDSDARWSVDAITRTEKKVLQLIAQNVVQDFDKGALVLTAREPKIDIQDSALFRSELEKEPKQSQNTDYLGHTLRYVLEYLDENKGRLDPSNVGVIVVTSALIEDEIAFGDGRDSFKKLIGDHQTVPTHVICCAAPDSKDSGRQAWRTRAQKMANYASETMGGSGSVTTGLTDDDARKAVANIRTAQSETVVMALNPVRAGNIGQMFTFIQTLRDGATRERTFDVGDMTPFKMWQEFWQGQVPVATYAPVSPISKASSATLTYFANNAIEETKSEGLSTELIIGIIVAAVVLALVVVLLLVRKNASGGKKSKSSTPVYATPSAPKPKETVVVLQEASGNKLTGTMKGGKLTIGRYAAKGAMLVIGNDGKLSGLHATLTKNGQGMTLTDNHSTNGTKVNGVPVTGTVPLNQNDSVTMGSSTYRVTWNG